MTCAMKREAWTWYLPSHLVPAKILCLRCEPCTKAYQDVLCQPSFKRSFFCLHHNTESRFYQVLNNFKSSFYNQLFISDYSNKTGQQICTRRNHLLRIRTLDRVVKLDSTQSMRCTTNSGNSAEATQLTTHCNKWICFLILNCIHTFQGLCALRNSGNSF